MLAPPPWISTMAERRESTLAHYEIVAKYGQYLLAKNLILDKVVPLAVKRGILKPKLGERLQKSDTSFFLAVLEKKSVQVFVEFLQCLAETFPSCKEHQSLVKAMSSDLLRVSNAPPELLSIVEDIVAAAEAGEVVTPSENAQQTALEEIETGITTSLIQPPNLPSSGETNRPPEVLEHPDQTETADDDSLSKSKTLVPLAGDFERLSLASESSDHKQDTAAGVLKEISTFSSPGGFIEPWVSKSFGREGGVFYCSSHGLEIDIPPGAILPSESDGQYKIFMHAYIKGPFHIPANIDIDPLTAVFLLNVYPPQQKFQKHIKLRMPHCAIVDDNSEFVALRASRPCDSTSDSYEFSEVLEADCLEDGYQLEVSVDHFSPFVGGRRRSSERKGIFLHFDSPKHLRQRRLRNSGKRRMPDVTKIARQTFASAKKLSSDGSLERSSSFDAPQSDKQEQPAESPSGSGLDKPLLPSSQDTVGGNQPGGPAGVERASSVKEDPSCGLYVAKWRPKICGRSWEEVFLVVGAHPTGKLALKQVVRNLEICTGQQYEIASLFGCNVKCVYSVAAVTDIIQFIPESWEDSDWKVLAQITPEISVCEVLCPHVGEGDFCVSRRDYQVQQRSNRNPEQFNFNCKIDVKGAKVGRALLYFTISYPPLLSSSSSTRPIDPVHMTDTSTVTSTLSIWSSLYSQIPAALQSGTEPTLGTLSEDLCRLLADMCFQLPGRHRRALLPQLVTREAERDRIEENHPQDKTEQFYWMLHAWTSRHPYTSLRDFLAFAGVVVKVISDCDCEGGAGMPFSKLNFDLCSASTDGQSTNSFFGNLASMVVEQRWFLARFLGVTKYKKSYTDDPNEQSMKLLQAWQSEKGHDATGGVLARTVYWLSEFDSRMCVAWEYVRKV